MRSHRILTLVTVASLLAGAVGCSKDETPAPGADPDASPTAWESLLDRVGEDGTMDTPTALAAFSLAIGPLPGVAAAPGRRGPIRSGTAAVASTLAHWPDLSGEQRRAVKRALTDGAATNQPAALRRGVRAADEPDVPCQAQDSPDAAPLRAVLNRQITEIATRLGRPLRLPTRLWINKTTQDGLAAMYANYCEAVSRRRTTYECTIHVNPAASAYSDKEKAAGLAHEAMHCFLMDMLGRGEDSLPLWLQEGIPMWAEAAVVGGTDLTTQAWQKYLRLDRRSLYRRAYDAVGFFAQLANSGVDVWKRIDPITQAYLKGGNDGAFAAAAAGPAFLRSWAAGHARGARPGPDWDITGYGVPAFRPPVATRAGATVTASAPEAGVDLVALTLPADSVVAVAGDPAARGLLGVAGADHEVADLVGKTLCTATGGCTCEAGSAQAGITMPPIAAGPGLLAVTGGPEAATVTLTIQARDAYCARPAHCVVGTWTHTNLDITYRSPDLTMRESGGAGFVFRIAPDGTATVDFDPMKPVRFTATNDIAGTLRYHGTARYRIALPPAGGTTGRMRAQAVDLRGLTASAQITKPFRHTVFDREPLAGLASGGGVSIDSQPMAGEHTFQCSSTRLVLAIVPDGNFTGTWTFARG